jgi:hypothetical protein
LIKGFRKPLVQSYNSFRNLLPTGVRNPLGRRIVADFFIMFPEVFRTSSIRNSFL